MKHLASITKPKIADEWGCLGLTCFKMPIFYESSGKEVPAWLEPKQA